jgi:hypothetical protein
MENPGKMGELSSATASSSIINDDGANCSPSKSISTCDEEGAPREQGLVEALISQVDEETVEEIIATQTKT